MNEDDLLDPDAPFMWYVSSQPMLPLCWADTCEGVDCKVCRVLQTHALELPINLFGHRLG